VMLIIQRCAPLPFQQLLGSIGFQTASA